MPNMDILYSEPGAEEARKLILDPSVDKCPHAKEGIPLEFFSMEGQVISIRTLRCRPCFTELLKVVKKALGITTRKDSDNPV